MSKSSDEKEPTRSEAGERRRAGTDEAEEKSGPKVVHDPKKWKLFWIVSIVSLVLDQATKIWARSSLPVGGHGSGANGTCVVPEDIIHRVCGGMPVKVIDGYWEWRLSMNPGSAFGLFGGIGPEITRWFLSAIGVAAVIGMYFMMRKARADQKILHWALALVAGGAVGNLIDRMIYSVVTDFILWKYKTHEWPVFNIADVVLVVGVGLMFFDISGEGKKEKAAKKERKAAARKRAREAGLVKDHRE
ncbi:MAG TPA: signal peptidase II [Kofleriaceae bacterium]|nr:signal peptidase II [Kofleriaceae bacterium]